MSEDIFRIELFGEYHNFKTTMEIPKARSIAEILVNEVARIEKNPVDGNIEQNKVAVLISAALNIAKENVEIKHEQKKLQEGTLQRADSILELLRDIHDE